MPSNGTMTALAAVAMWRSARCRLAVIASGIGSMNTRNASGNAMRFVRAAPRNNSDNPGSSRTMDAAAANWVFMAASTA